MELSSIRAVLSSISIIGLMAAGALVVTAFTASPASANCSHYKRYADGGQYQVIRAGSTGLAYRTGPHTGCALLGRIVNGDYVTAWCWDYGDEINGVPTWSYVSVPYFGDEGWVSDYYLANQGANTVC